MLGKLKRCFQKNIPNTVNAIGLHCPQSGDELLNTRARQLLLQQLWDNVSLPKSLYQQLYLQPLKMLLSRVQLLPASEQGRWSTSGSFADLTLQFTLCAVKLARGQLFPSDSSPETQSVEGTLWQAAIFYSAMCYHLPLLKSIEAELDDGSLWLPGATVPLKPFRFRFIATNNLNYTPWLTARLLPDEAIRWLSTAPNALHCLIAQCAGQPSAVSAILIKAAEVVGAPDLTARSSNIQGEGFSVDNCSNEARDEPDESTNNTHGLNAPEPAFELASAIQQTDTALLLSLFDGNHPESSPIENEPAKTESPTGLGQHFLDWLSTSLISQTLPVNTAQSHVHLMGGTVFLCVPAIFHHYLKETDCPEDKTALQRAFEKCKCHQVIDGNRFRQGRLYSTVDKTGHYSKVSGYLIKSAKVYQHHTVPPDSQFIVLK